MTDEPMPEWMRVDDDDALDGMCDASIQPEEPLADDDVAGAVLVAGVDPDDEDAKAARRAEYAALFPAEALRDVL